MPRQSFICSSCRGTWQKGDLFCCHCGTLPPSWTGARLSRRTLLLAAGIAGSFIVGCGGDSGGDNGSPPVVHEILNPDLDRIGKDRTTALLLLDVWGEGRIDDRGLTTGFDQALNLNKRTQKVSNGANRGQDIPNLVPVEEYDNPQFPIDDGVIDFITLMGAPITNGTAREMYRVLNKSSGVVILYNPLSGDRQTFEANKGDLVYKPQDPLGHPFEQISLSPAYIYGFGSGTDHDEL